MIKLAKLQLLRKKNCEIWPPGGAAPILNISVLGRFEHVPTCLNGISQCQIDKHQTTELMEEKKMVVFARLSVNRVFVKDIRFFHFSMEMTIHIKKLRTFFFLNGVWGRKVINVIFQLKPYFTYFV